MLRISIFGSALLLFGTIANASATHSQKSGNPVRYLRRTYGQMHAKRRKVLRVPLVPAAGHVF
jgi:hypothetical protein